MKMIYESVKKEYEERIEIYWKISKSNNYYFFLFISE